MLEKFVKLYKTQTIAAIEKKDDTVRLSEHFSPTILEGESCFLESFHAVPKMLEFLLSAVRELPEL